MVQISQRTQTLGTENAFVVLKEVNSLLDKGEDIANFCIGQPNFDTPKYIKQAAIKAINEGKTGYTPSPGIPELRKAVAEYMSETRKIDVKPMIGGTFPLKEAEKAFENSFSRKGVKTILKA